MLLVTNAAVYAPDRVIAGGAVLVDGGRIAYAGPVDGAPRPAGVSVIDASGLALVPGFIDLQINGAFGHDFTDDPSSIWTVASALPRFGVTTFLPTIITSPLETVAAARRAVVDGRPSGFRGAEPLGLHLEGPFLNPAKKGAHNGAYLRPPAPDAVAQWSPPDGVRLVTLAPELPGARGVVTALTERGVVVSAGHSMATFEEAVAGFDAGIRYGTHLFNAMPVLHHREPGLPGALLADSRTTVGLIADGIHTHRAIVPLVWQAVGASRVTLVTDAMAALGMPPGAHRLGELHVQVDRTGARLADGTLAGSVLSMDQALRNVMAFTGRPLAEVLRAVTHTPARLLGLDNERGAIRPGLVADLVLLSSDHQVRLTVAGGEVVYRAPAA
jgi:N-acetylglucosamine-6-phosphate deacetylase